MYLIGEASTQSGVHIETIRYYEREGVVTKPDRTAAGRRLYTKDEVAKLRFVRRCRDLGFPIPIIKTLLSLSSDSGRACGEVKTLADNHLVEIEKKIESLIGLRAALQSLSESCDSGTSSCPILTSLMSDFP